MKLLYFKRKKAKWSVISQHNNINLFSHRQWCATVTHTGLYYIYLITRNVILNKNHCSKILLTLDIFC